jgi:hypothetical protein
MAVIVRKSRHIHELWSRVYKSRAFQTYRTYDNNFKYDRDSNLGTINAANPELKWAQSSS